MTPRAGGPRWRRERGLETIGDHVRRYLAQRHPRGSYRTPMPEDLLPAWREVV